MKPRTRARGTALQILYEIDLVDHPIGTTIKNRIDDEGLEDRLANFVSEIVRGIWPVLLHQEPAKYHWESASRPSAVHLP